jgi:hypothetical protein
VELKDERLIPESELNDMGPSALLAHVEGGFRFCIKTNKSRLQNFPSGPLNRLCGFREVYALHRQP